MHRGGRCVLQTTDQRHMIDSTFRRSRQTPNCDCCTAGTAESDPVVPAPSGSNAAPPRAASGREASFGTPGLSGGRGTQGTPRSARNGRPSFSGSQPSLGGNRRRSVGGDRRRSMSQMTEHSSPAGPSPLDRGGWRGDLGQFQGQRARLQDRRRSFSVPLSPVASAVHNLAASTPRCSI